MKLMKLEIVTPEGVIFDDEIKQVTIPGSEGEFGVLADHATLVSLLKAGVMVIETADSKEISVAVNGGYVKVEEEKTLCVVDGAVALNAEGTELASKLEEAREMLEKAQSSSKADILAAKSKIDGISKGR
ncbi:F0F1 ATP synthase subunit epsilon [Sulfurovum sp. bin170]|uniref:ATP synthase F1 subunit epsilon n=1 Tax=Sulfurovum sp. bin170 TaxID=2695268 RepID=UPI0013DF0819|nr:ATP synthase F1 subunit epsilon [Sulfurovum sp. bin170]NEW60450.1 F0F1 ATP synthase subunit epsilon [Sulfurovum sp. bin170]